ncbi:MAG: hypothetical protein AVDCRST_MAG58-1405 [uncultured Rubrobacteraceae bacterium]|uniref:Uncharacterized protein n=1 Tax=uncultured Rubrobacteraceae bacterium TaxID=349277 RepID=A0A6J4QUR6_9ACTN|nr:MAG: hypothetical protein AVDCRST_MAG58-1405 [uncultured Rubrobacteraceae bacterium]
MLRKILAALVAAAMLAAMMAMSGVALAQGGDVCER